MAELARIDIVRHFQTAADWLLGAIIDQNSDCIKLLALDGTLEYINRAGHCALGIDDFADAAGKPWSSLWPAEARELVRESVCRARAGETVRFEARWPTADGDTWWDVTVGPVRDPSGEIRQLASISREITELVAAREAADAVAAEMAHRLRNAYAITSALLGASARGDPALEEFALDVADRFRRLGAAQTLMLSSGDGKVSLEALIAELTHGFDSESAPIEIGKVPDLSLDSRKLKPLALTIGELCTNSAKYGALGHGGSVAISATGDGRRLSIRWSERSARPVASRERDGGTGFQLIGRVLAAQKGTLEIEWREDGLDAVISVMLD